MRPLIDADILLYEVGFAGQSKDEDTEELVYHSFDYVKEILDEKIRIICDAVWATEEPVLYITGPNNFRNDIAKTKPYKGTRKAEKPFHYKNLKAYMKAAYNCVVTDGIEADDAICIEQTKHLDKLDTIICTRDKDLRICPGMHFGWEVGNQPQFGPKRVSKLGYLEPIWKEKLNAKGETVAFIDSWKGAGLKFFYAQLIMGDPTDNIPGLPRGGNALIHKLGLADMLTEKELYEAVSGAYEDKVGEDWKSLMTEQGRLLWMVQELDDNNEPVMWEHPYD